MDENSNFDIVLNTKVNDNGLDDLGKKIEALESKDVKITADYTIKENGSAVKASKLNKVNEAIGRILDIGGKSETVDKTFNVKFNADTKDLPEKISEISKAVAKLNSVPESITREINISAKTTGIDETFTKIASLVQRLEPEKLINAKSVEDQFDSLIEQYDIRLESFRKKMKQLADSNYVTNNTEFSEKYQENFDKAGRSARELLSIVSQIDYLYNNNISLLEEKNVPLYDEKGFKDFISKYKESLKSAYEAAGLKGELFEEQFGTKFLKESKVDISKITEQAQVAKRSIGEVSEEAQEATGATEKITNKLAKIITDLAQVMQGLSTNVNTFKNTFDSVNDTTLSPMSQTVSVLQEYIHSTNNTIRALESNVKTVNTEVDKMDQSIKQLSNVEDKEVKIKINIEDNGLKALSDILNEINDKTYKVNVEFEVPDKLETIAKSIKAIANGLVKIENVKPDTLSKHLEVKLGNQPKESTPEVATPPVSPEVPTNPDIINNLTSIGTKLDSIYEKLGQTITVDFASDSVIKTQLLQPDDGGYMSDETILDRIQDIQGRLEWTNDFIGEALESKESGDRDNNSGLSDTQIANLVDAINRAITENNGGVNTDAVEGKLDSILAKLGDTFKTEVTNFGTLVNSNGGFLTQAQLAQLMALLNTKGVSAPNNATPTSDAGNPKLIGDVSATKAQAVEFRDRVKVVLDTFDIIGQYMKDTDAKAPTAIKDFEKIYSELQSIFAGAEDTVKKLSKPNVTEQRRKELEVDLKSQQKGFGSWSTTNVAGINNAKQISEDLEDIVENSKYAAEKLEAVRNTIKLVDAAGGDTSGLEALAQSLENVYRYAENKNILGMPALFKQMMNLTYNGADNIKLFDFKDRDVDIDKFSKKVQQLKKYIKQLSDVGGDAKDALSNIGSLDNTQLDTLLNGFENNKNEYIRAASTLGSGDRDLLKTQYYTNNIEPLIEYINRLNEVEEVIKRITIAKRDEDKADAKAEQAQNAEIARTKKLNDAYVRLRKWSETNSKALGIDEFAKRYDELMERIANGANMTDQEVKQLNADIALLNKDVKAAGMSGKTFGTVLGELYKKYGGWAFITKSLNYTVRLLKDMVSQVREVDTAMTDLRKVTEANEKQLKKYLDAAGGRSVDIGSSLTDYINATSEFSRLGKTLDEAENLGRLATIYKTVGEDLDIQTASQSIISTMQAYEKIGVTADEIVDKFNYTGNNFAITSKGVGEALQRSAASLNAAGNSLNESIGLITAGNSIIQNTETMGTALKTISARIRGTTDELDEYGEEISMTTGELRKNIMNIAHIDIMADESTFKSTYEILKEISAVYDELSDADRADIAEMLGGKVGLNVVQAIISNFKTAEKVVSDLDNGLAKGSASKELEKSLDSIDGKLNQLKSDWQQLATDTVSSDAVKLVIDAAKTILELLDKIAKSGLSAGAGVATALGLTGMQMKTGSGRVRMFTLDEYARVSSGGNTERVDIVIVISARELWKNYRTWCISQRVL